jgi:hypothetical protein
MDFTMAVADLFIFANISLKQTATTRNFFMHVRLLLKKINTIFYGAQGDWYE